MKGCGCLVLCVVGLFILAVLLVGFPAVVVAIGAAGAAITSK